jgi:hypothetical protein
VLFRSAFERRLPLYVACVQTPFIQSLFTMVNAPLPPGTRVRLQVRGGRLHAETLP